MTRSAEDLTLLMRTLVPALDDTSTTKLPRAFYAVGSNSKVEADASLLAGLDDAARALEKAGITRREFPEGLLDDAVEIWFAMMSLSGSPEYARLLGQRPISPLRELLKFPLGRSSHSLPALLVAFAEGLSGLAGTRLEDFKRKGEELQGKA